MVYLVGCDHNRHQTFDQHLFNLNGLLSSQQDFKNFLREKIIENSISLVAEELSDPDELDIDHPYLARRSSIAQALVQELRESSKIKHCYCDPCSRQKYMIGIGGCLPYLCNTCDCADKKQRLPVADKCDSHFHEWAHRFPIREIFWLSCIAEKKDENILFICGALHRCTFRERLGQAGFKVKILKKYFGHDSGFMKEHVCAEEFRAYVEVRRMKARINPRCFCVNLRTPPIQAENS